MPLGGVGGSEHGSGVHREILFWKHLLLAGRGWEGENGQPRCEHRLASEFTVSRLVHTSQVSGSFLKGRPPGERPVLKLKF